MQPPPDQGRAMGADSVKQASRARGFGTGGSLPQFDRRLGQRQRSRAELRARSTTGSVGQSIPPRADAHVARDFPSAIKRRKNPSAVLTIIAAILGALLARRDRAGRSSD